MRIGKSFGLALAIVAGACGGKHADDPAVVVNFQALTSGAEAASVTFDALSHPDAAQPAASARVTAYDATSTGRAFSGAVQLAPGTYVFRARSFDANGTELGTGDADNGNPITTVKGGDTSVSITIRGRLNASSGPSITSFVATPTGSVVAVNAPVTLVATVRFDGAGPVRYAWTQDCAHGVFTTPTDGLSATWRDPVEESCTLTFTATDPSTGASDSRSVRLTCSCLAASALVGSAPTTCR